MRMFSRRAMLAAALSGLAAPGLARVPGQPPLPRPRRDGAGIIARAKLAGRVSFALCDPVTGQMPELQDAEAPVTPASTMKLLTALYGLERLGPDFRFRTRLLRDGEWLILAGGGDPLLSSDGLAQLASDLAALSLPAPKRFAVWAGALPQLPQIAPEQAGHVAYNPSVSGLILNFNRVHLGWQRVGGDYHMRLEARAQRHSPPAFTITAQPGDQSRPFSYLAEPGRESWTVSGAAMGKSGSRWLPVRQPALYAGDVFQTLCREKGVILPAPEVIETLPVTARELASRASPPLHDILRGMLRHSTNLTAEVVGLRASGAADLHQSGQAMRDWLAGLPGLEGGLEHFVLADHSGLSAESRVTAGAMARILAGPALATDLPALLRRSTLGDRDDDRDDGPRAQIAAKSGTLNFVSNLAGYLDRQGQPPLCFATMCADPPRHKASTGAEQPAGARGWTGRARRLQRDLLLSWAARFG